jgi:hypothetical protein
LAKAGTSTTAAIKAMPMPMARLALFKEFNMFKL